MEILDFGKIDLLITENKFLNRCLGLVVVAVAAAAVVVLVKMIK